MAVLVNAKHEAVLQTYLADPSKVGWRAYRSVYKKSSQRAAETAWSRLLKGAEFAAALAAATEQVRAAAISKATMDLQEVLEELSKLGRSNLQHHLAVGGDDTGEVIAALADMAPEHAAAIQEMTVETYMEGAGDDAREVKRVKLKLHSKPAALTELRRHLEPQKHEHSFSGIAERLATALARTGEQHVQVRPDRDAARAGGARKAAPKGKPARAR